MGKKPDKAPTVTEQLQNALARAKRYGDPEEVFYYQELLAGSAPAAVASFEQFKGSHAYTHWKRKRATEIQLMHIKLREDSVEISELKQMIAKAEEAGCTKIGFYDDAPRYPKSLTRFVGSKAVSDEMFTRWYTDFTNGTLLLPLAHEEKSNGTEDRDQVQS